MESKYFQNKNDLSGSSQKHYDEPGESGSSSNTKNINSQTLLRTPQKSIKRAYPERCSNEKFTSSKRRRGEKHRANIKDVNEFSDHKELASNRLLRSTPRKRELKKQTKLEALIQRLEARHEAQRKEDEAQRKRDKKEMETKIKNA